MAGAAVGRRRDRSALGFPRDGWAAVGRLITEKTHNWDQVIRAANIKPK